MESDDSVDSRVSRREMMTLAGTGAVGAVAIGGGSMVLSDSANATMQIETEEMEFTTPDGIAEEIRIGLDCNCTYSNVEEEVTFINFAVSLNGETLVDGPVSIDSPEVLGEKGPHSGDIILQLQMAQHSLPYPLFEESSFEPSDFEVPEDGTSETFEMNFEAEFSAMTGDDHDTAEAVATASSSTTAQMTIINEEDGDNGGGNPGDGGGSDPTPEATMKKPSLSIYLELPNGDTATS